jgi:diguanylate cyclase (GGDEF)-like protein
MYLTKRYFVIAITLLMTIGFLSTSLISYFVARDSLSKDISEQMLPLTSDNIYSEIQRDLLRPVLISSFMATDTFVQEWVSGGEQSVSAIQSYLTEIRQQFGTITAFFVSEQTRLYYHPDGILRTVLESNPEDAWYFRVRSLTEEYEVNIDLDTADRNRLSIFINYRVLDGSGQYIGVTGVGLSVNAVSELIESYQQRYGRTIYFVDRAGNIALSQSLTDGPLRIQEIPGLADQSEQILNTNSTSFSYASAEGEVVYLNSRLVAEFDWYLVVEQHDADAEARIRNTLLVNIGLSLSVMVLVLLFAHFTLKAYQRRLEEMATTDGLTGVANRHVFDSIVEQVRRSAKRRKKKVSLVSIDIDHFKEVNDTYGHQAGDEILKIVATGIQDQIRESDTLCRWGGEEFLLLLDDCTLQQAAERAETVRRFIKKQLIQIKGENVRVTLSCGVTECGIDEALFEVVTRVDEALYRAKREGRDRVVIATVPTGMAPLQR